MFRTAVVAVVGLVMTAGNAVSSHIVAPHAQAGMTLQQKVGQLFMVGSPAGSADQRTLDDIGRYHLGNIILTGRSSAGVTAIRQVVGQFTAQVNASSTANTGLFVSADQEGGEVQVLQGPGFSSIPTALNQGTQSSTTQRGNARTWAAQLKSAGVNVNLAPVLDTVPSAQFAPQNPPIGAYDREYGYDPATVSAHGGAFAQGMADAGVAATVKHFPGLGRVTANTDTTTGVTDMQTTRTDAYLMPFRDAVGNGAPFLMMSTAFYPKIDPANPAAFSPTVVTGMVRGDLGFGGVVVSDDLAAAAQVSDISSADRATRFVQAGGDMILIVDPSVLPAMYDAVLAQAQSDPSFAAQVDASVTRILAAKRNAGLTG